MIENKFHVWRDYHAKSSVPVHISLDNVCDCISDADAINLAIYLLNAADSDLDKFLPLWNSQFEENKVVPKEEPPK